MFNSHVKEEVKLKCESLAVEISICLCSFMSVIHGRVYQGEMAGHLDLQGLPDLQDRSSTSQQAMWVER